MESKVLGIGETLIDIARKVPRPLLHATIAVGLLMLVLWRANPWELDDQYRDFNVWLLAAVVVLNVPILAFVTLRGWLILKRQGYSTPMLPIVPIATLGHVAGSITPASAGDLVRTPYFKEFHAVPYSEGLAIVVYERGLSVITLILSTGAAACWLSLPVQAAAPATLCIMAGLAGSWRLASVLLRWFEPWRERLAGASDDPSFVSRSMRSLGASLSPLHRLLHDDWLGSGVVGLSLGIFAVMALQMYLVARALGVELSAAESWTAHGVGVLAAVLSLVPFGLGPMDAALAAVVGATEAGLAAGAAMAALVRVATTLPQGVAALLSYVWLSTRPARASDARHPGQVPGTEA